MQFDLLRAFPYPVLRPGVDDYLDSDIQAEVHLTPSDDGSELAASVDFQLSVDELGELVASDCARYGVVFACRDTYFRRAAMSSDPSYGAAFAAGSLRGQVMIYPYIVATKDISDFTCQWINPEFGPGPHCFPRGAPLALDQPHELYVDREAFKPLSSCFSLVKADELPPNEWKVQAEGDKVQIAIAPALKERIDSARNSKENRAILMNSIYFGAVMQCLSFMKQGGDYYEWRWAEIFRQRLADRKIELDNHPESWIAQQLLHHPIGDAEPIFLWRRGRMKIRFLKQRELDELRARISENLDRYRNGDFEYLMTDPAFSFEHDVDIDTDVLQELQAPAGTALWEPENCLVIYASLSDLSPYEARDERLWVYLSHTLLLEHARLRWPIPASDDEAIRHVAKHFFARDKRQVERDNVGSRLWWMAHLCARIEGLDLEDALRAFLHRSDVRANLVERPTTSQTSKSVRSTSHEAGCITQG